ncbi:nitrate/nitrite transporter NrtS [Thalassomonas actiniarum]|uniref:Nitrate/nitrite transporter NrtS n=1 Tax=Thalassomonas actiniarum TaxID=485447 RepID=A0AAE9YUQ0_9GAMM|nr:nitrate/nitrite transporter NrtS [Thalassomonas actiniarum]
MKTSGSSFIHWFHLATRAKVITRSLKVALIVGTILVMINQLDVFLSGQLALGNYIQILLTYCVPYCVSTYASVDTMMNLENK